jgi:hypothetical protein
VAELAQKVLDLLGVERAEAGGADQDPVQQRVAAQAVRAQSPGAALAVVVAHLALLDISIKEPNIADTHIIGGNIGPLVTGLAGKAASRAIAITSLTGHMAHQTLHAHLVRQRRADTGRKDPQIPALEVGGRPRAAQGDEVAGCAGAGG